MEANSTKSSRAVFHSTSVGPLARRYRSSRSHLDAQKEGLCRKDEQRETGERAAKGGKQGDEMESEGGSVDVLQEHLLLPYFLFLLIEHQTSVEGVV